MPGEQTGSSTALPTALNRVGSTGSGESTLLLNMILDDIHARRGTIVIGPKGDLIIDLLDRIPAKLAKRLVLIDPDQPEGTTLNPLAGDDHDLVVDNVSPSSAKIFAKLMGATAHKAKAERTMLSSRQALRRSQLGSWSC